MLLLDPCKLMRLAQFVSAVLGLEHFLQSGEYVLGTPKSDAVDHVNPYANDVPLHAFFFMSLFISMIGNGGDSPNGSGGMIPSTGRCIESC